MFTGRRIVFGVRQAKAAAPFVLAVLDHRDRNSRNMGRSHELRNGSLDLSPLFR